MNINKKPCEAPADSRGTTNCPICGESGIHKHTGDEIGRSRIAELKKSSLGDDHKLYFAWVSRAFGSRQPAGSWETWLAAKAIYQPKRTALSPEWYRRKIAEYGDLDCSAGIDQSPVEP